jgi:hypothetical protein
MKHVSTHCGQNVGVSGVFAKFRKAAVSFAMTIIHPSDNMGQFGFHWTDLYENWFLNFFENQSRKFKFY